MPSIEKCPVPVNTFLETYLAKGNYVDCYVTSIDKQITFAEFVFGFYTTWLFKTERLILKLLVNKPSSDLQAKQLADNEIDHFAVWTVERRGENEILMCDFLSRTRSWLMVEKAEAGTKLHFGSAVVPAKGSESLDFGFRALLRFHQIYSILLLYAAKRKLLSK